MRGFIRHDAESSKNVRHLFVSSPHILVMIYFCFKTLAPAMLLSEFLVAVAIALCHKWSPLAPPPQFVFAF